MGTKTDKSGGKCIDKKKGHWSLGLLQTIKDPEAVVFEDNLVTVIKDKYPKATFHYLVCPKANVASLNHVKTEHLPLLKHMGDVAKKIASKHAEKKFLFGYHAIASMVRLHLHVISDDFNSSFLKNKKHWNSFTTDYFRPSALIIEQLKAEKSIKLSESDFKKLLDTPLKCHKCEFVPKNMPDLKKHIQIHL